MHTRIVPANATIRLRAWIHRIINIVDSYSLGKQKHYTSLIEQSSLFDADWYCSKYSDVAKSSMDPLDHYIRHGAAEGRDPHPLFNSGFYKKQVGKSAHRRPLLHYLTADPLAAVSPHPLFDSNWYLKNNPDVASAKVDPLVHYLTRGAIERRDPSAVFSTRAYLLAHPELRVDQVNPLVHFIEHSRQEYLWDEVGDAADSTFVRKSYGAQGTVYLLDAAQLSKFALLAPHSVAVVVPSIDTEKAKATSHLLVRRAGMPVTVVIAEDTSRQGYVATLNAVADRMRVKYIVYAAEDAFAGLNWLKTAYDRLEGTGKALLAFNCGKWRGRIAAFGMVRSSWVKSLYGGPVFYPKYKRHKADNELTVIARVQRQYVYEPDAVLVEIDPAKPRSDPSPVDRKLFQDRFRAGFDGHASRAALAPLAKTYSVDFEGKHN